MIPANELRIGNSFYHTNTFCNPYMKLLPEDFKNELSSDGIFHQFDPIPLTEEVLLACGFENDARNWKQKGDFFLEIREHGQWINGKPEGEIKYMAYKGGIGAIKEVKYLHDLQNLFFAIKNSELVYNPS